MSRDRFAAHDLARAIAPHLPGWHAETLEDHDCAYLARADGAKIALDVNGYRREGRVSFWGLSPAFADGTRYFSGSERIEITVDAKRPPETIARELRRRFLPRYDHTFAQALAYVKTHAAAVDEARAIALRIASTIGGELGPNKSRSGDGIHIRREPNAIYRLRVDPAHGDTPASVSFEAHDIDPETAAEVLALIKAAEDRKHAERTRVSFDAPFSTLEIADAEEEDARRGLRRIG